MPNKINFGPNNSDTTILGSVYQNVKDKDLLYAYPSEFEDTINNDYFPSTVNHTEFGNHNGIAYKAVSSNNYPYVTTFRFVKNNKDTLWQKIPDPVIPMTGAAYAVQLISFNGTFYMIVAVGSSGIFTYKLENGNWTFVNQNSSYTAFSLSAAIYNNAGIQELWIAISTTNSNPYLKTFRLSGSSWTETTGSGLNSISGVAWSSDYLKTVKIIAAFGGLALFSVVDNVMRGFYWTGSAWSVTSSESQANSFSVDAYYNGKTNYLYVLFTANSNVSFYRLRYITSLSSWGSTMSMSVPSTQHYSCSIGEFKGYTVATLDGYVFYADHYSSPTATMSRNSEWDLNNYISRIFSFHTIDEYALLGTNNRNYNVYYLSQNDERTYFRFSAEKHVLDQPYYTVSYPFKISEIPLNGKYYMATPNPNIPPYYTTYRKDTEGWVRWKMPEFTPGGTCYGAGIHNHNGTLYLFTFWNSSPFMNVFYYDGDEWIKIANPIDPPAGYYTVQYKSFDFTTFKGDGKLYVAFNYGSSNPSVYTYVLNEANMTWTRISSFGTTPSSAYHSVSLQSHEAPANTHTLYLATVGANSTIFTYKLNSAGNSWESLSNQSGNGTGYAVDLTSYYNRATGVNELWMGTGFSGSPYLYLDKLSGTSWSRQSLFNFGSSQSTTYGVKLVDYDNQLVAFYGTGANIVPYILFPTTTSLFYYTTWATGATQYNIESYIENEEIELLHWQTSNHNSYGSGPLGIRRYVTPILKNQTNDNIEYFKTNDLHYYPYFNSAAITTYNNQMYSAVSMLNYYPHLNTFKFNDTDGWFYEYKKPNNGILPWFYSTISSHGIDMISYSNRLIMVMGTSNTSRHFNGSLNSYDAFYHLYTKENDASEWVKRELPSPINSTTYGVSLFNFNGTLYLALARGSVVYIYTSTTGTSWTYRQQISYSGTSYKIAFANFNNVLHLAVSSSSSPYFYVYTLVGGISGTWLLMNQPGSIPTNASYSTALAVYNNELYAATTSASNPFILTYKYDPTVSSFVRLTDPDVLGLTSSAYSTDMISFGDSLYLIVAAASAVGTGLKLTMYQKTGTNDWIKMANPRIGLPGSSRGTGVKFNIYKDRLYAFVTFDRSPFMFTYQLSLDGTKWEKLSKKFWGTIPLGNMRNEDISIGVAKENGNKNQTIEITRL
jgi:hypothetical protein